SRPLAAWATSPLTNAIADGPDSIGETWSPRPASVAATLASVFLVTLNVALPLRLPRSSDICATVRPRYSVSTAPLESRNLPARSSITAVFSAFAMSLLPMCRPCVIPEDDERPGRRSTRGDRPRPANPRGFRANRDMRLAWSPARDVRTEPSASELASSGLRQKKVYVTHTDSTNQLGRCTAAALPFPGAPPLRICARNLGDRGLFVEEAAG